MKRDMTLHVDYEHVDGVEYSADAEVTHDASGVPHPTVLEVRFKRGRDVVAIGAIRSTRLDHDLIEGIKTAVMREFYDQCEMAACEPEYTPEEAAEGRMFREDQAKPRQWALLRDAYASVCAVAAIYEAGCNDVDPKLDGTIISAEEGEALLRAKLEIKKAIRCAMERGETLPEWAREAIQE